MRKHNKNLLGVGWYYPDKKRPFAYSTKATSDLICILYQKYGNLIDVYNNINFDEDAKFIIKCYLDKGINNLNLGSI